MHLSSTPAKRDYRWWWVMIALPSIGVALFVLAAIDLLTRPSVVHGVATVALLVLMLVNFVMARRHQSR